MAKSLQGTTVIIGLLIGITLFNMAALLLQQASHHVAASTYKWYRTPQSCLKSTMQQGEMVDLAGRATTALNRLGLEAPVCYGTLWGVLRNKDVLPWDNNVDFCVLKEYLANTTFSDMQKTFAEEGIVLHDFSYTVGSYRMQRGMAEGFINVFANCTHLVPVLYPHLNIPAMPGEEKLHWACAYSLASVIGKYTHDLNNPFPSWILTPPFSYERFGDTQVKVPHDNFEIQKYLYPDDWWMQVKPLGCL